MLNFVDLGGVGDGVTDNASIWEKAFAALGPYGEAIYVPAGKYLSSNVASFRYPLTALFTLTIYGDGADATTLYSPSTGGFALWASKPRHGFHFRDLTISTGVQGRCGLNLQNTVAEGNFAQNDITRCTFRGDDGGQGQFSWTYSAYVSNFSNVNFDGCLFYGSGNGTGTGITLDSTNPAIPGIVYNLSKCGFFNLGVGLTYGSVQGVTIDQCNFTNGVTGILAPPGKTNLSQLAITNSQFNTTGNQIFAQSQIGNLLLSNNLFLIGLGGNGIVLFGGGQWASIVGNQFLGVAQAPAGTGIAVAQSPFQQGVVQGNLFSRLTAATAIPTAVNWNVGSNLIA